MDINVDSVFNSTLGVDHLPFAWFGNWEALTHVERTHDYMPEDLVPSKGETHIAKMEASSDTLLCLDN